MSARYPDAFLEELKRSVSVLDAVGRRHKMRKQGSEYVATDDTSLKVNTVKNVWRDFGKGDHGGDIFEFEMHSTGCTFQEAVEALAQFAGLPLPKTNGAGTSGPLGPEPPPAEPDDYGAQPGRQARAITATYDYRDADGLLAYQVCRQEWIGDDGRRKKSFLQRRPHGPVVDDPAKQPWIWGLGEGVYLRGRDGNFYSATKDRVVKWKDAERIEVEACAHGLFLFPELRDELAQDEPERRVVFVPEGERDCQTLVAWDLVATTNSGGASNWRSHHAEELRGADVVVVEDHDEAGRKRSAAIASSLTGVAKSVKVLRWPHHWPGCPVGTDITDWRDKAGGDAGKFFEIVEGLPDWTPGEAEAESDTSDGATSKTTGRSLVPFPLVSFENIRVNTERRDYLVKGLLPSTGLAVIWGPPKCYKSFWATDLALHIALGWDYRGRRVQQGPVVYIALEGSGGLPPRIQAFRSHYGLDDHSVQFYLITAPLNLIKDAKALNVSIKEQLGDIHPRAVFIDTLNRSLVGSESKDEDMARYLAATGQIEEAFNCLVAIVHHCGVDATRPRGHTSLPGAVAVQIAITKPDKFQTIATIETAKDFAEGDEIFSRLESVGVGTDPDGDPITSLVVTPAEAMAARRQTSTRKLSDRQRLGLDALAECAATSGEPAPPSLQLPAGIIVVKVTAWTAELYARGVLDRNAASPREDLRRLQQQLQRRGLIGVRNDLVWRA